MWSEILRQLLDAFGLAAAAEREALFGGTATEVYRLPSG